MLKLSGRACDAAYAPKDRVASGFRPMPTSSTRSTAPRTQTVCVKVIDVFGCDTSVTLDVGR